MNGKYRISLSPELEAVIKISLEVPTNERSLAALRGYGPQEVDNLLGQKFQEIIDFFNLADQP